MITTLTGEARARTNCSKTGPCLSCLIVVWRRGGEERERTEGQGCVDALSVSERQMAKFLAGRDIQKE
jgi:hypothetical protein